MKSVLKFFIIIFLISIVATPAYAAKKARYQNEDYRINIRVPPGWQMEEMTADTIRQYTFYDPKKKERAYKMQQAELESSMEEPDISIEEKRFYEKQLEDLKSQFETEMSRQERQEHLKTINRRLIQVYMFPDDQNLFGQEQFMVIVNVYDARSLSLQKSADLVNTDIAKEVYNIGEVEDIVLGGKALVKQSGSFLKNRFENYYHLRSDGIAFILHLRAPEDEFEDTYDQTYDNVVKGFVSGLEE